MIHLITLARICTCLRRLDPFQKKIISLLEGEPDSRKIMYIYDAGGNTGKSKLAKYLLSHHEDSVLIPFDTANQIKAGLASYKKAARLFICNVPRTLGINEQKNFDDLFSVVESLKDGMLSSFYYGKYSQKIFNVPHVVIFSNHKNR